ncbi:MAG: alpha/beta fold hydrolase, partial [Archangium sp.]
GHSLDSSSLRSALQQHLPEYMVPSAFLVLEALPLSPNGKLDRTALPAPDASASHRTAHVTPRDEVEHQLARIWEELLEAPSVGVHDDFFELGGHSLLAVRLMARIRERFGQSLPVATLFQGATVEHLARQLRGGPTAKPTSTLVALNASGSRHPFFCVHPVGGGVLSYVALARALGEDQPFYALQAPGVDGDQLPLNRLEALAARHLESIREVQPHGPYLLGGWSFGGMVALEMARQLQEQGEQVALVALIDTYLPSAERAGTEPSDEELQALFLRDLARTAGQTAELPEEQLASLRRVFESHLRAGRHYTPRPHAGPLTLFRAAESPAGQATAPDRGFAALAAGGLDVEEVPGDHYSLLHQPHVRTLAERLAEHLERSTPMNKSKTGMAK